MALIRWTLKGVRPYATPERANALLAYLNWRRQRAGIRIDEALTLHTSDVDLGQSFGEGPGEGTEGADRSVLIRSTPRPVPVVEATARSVALRLVVSHPHRQPHFTPEPARAHYELLKRLGLPQCGFHRLRHTFATSWLRNGGDVVRLSRVLGHSQLTTTMHYLHMQTQDLQQSHQQVSILERLSK